METNYEWWETEVQGECLGAEWQGVVAVVNPNLQPQSGDVVCVWVVDQVTKRARSMLKILEATRDGRWWLQCLEGTVPINAYFVPAEIRPVVGKYARRGPTNRDDQSWRQSGIVADRRLAEFWDKQNVDARVEWTSQGKVRFVSFPGIAAALAAGTPASDWPGAYRLAADYFPLRRELT